MDPHNRDVVEMSEASVELCRELQRVRRQAAELRAREARLREQILEAFSDEGPHEAVTASGTKACHIERSEATSVDRKRLESIYPDVFQDVSKTSPRVTLKIDLDGDADAERQEQIREALGGFTPGDHEARP